MDERWLSYLYQAHSEVTLRGWAKRLQLFRFVRAAGGHANDGDELLVAYRYASGSELDDFFARLGVKLTRHERVPPQMQPARVYAGDEHALFPSLIPSTEWVEQPKRQEIAGQSVFIWCSADQIKLTIGHAYEVKESDIRSAELLEPTLRSAVVLPRVDPPVERVHCVCPQYYPDFFASA